MCAARRSDWLGRDGCRGRAVLSEASGRSCGLAGFWYRRVELPIGRCGATALAGGVTPGAPGAPAAGGVSRRMPSRSAGPGLRDVDDHCRNIAMGCTEVSLVVWLQGGAARLAAVGVRSAAPGRGRGLPGAAELHNLREPPQRVSLRGLLMTLPAGIKVKVTRGLPLPWRSSDAYRLPAASVTGSAVPSVLSWRPIVVVLFQPRA